MLQGSGSLGMGSGLSGATESESLGLEKAPFAWLAVSVSFESRETLSESSRHPGLSGLPTGPPRRVLAVQLHAAGSGGLGFGQGWARD